MTCFVFADEPSPEKPRLATWESEPLFEFKQIDKDKDGKPHRLSYKSKLSYALGLSAGRSLLAQGVDVSADAFARGVFDVVKKAKEEKKAKERNQDQAFDWMVMSEEEAGKLLEEYNKMQQKELRKSAELRDRKLAEENLKRAETFFANNAKEEGVVTRESGLQYKVLREGTVDIKPEAHDIVTVHYKGELLDGTTFDNSWFGGNPSRVGVATTIPGWAEVLQLMPLGARWKVWLPPALAYGRKRVNEMIHPNSALVFEIDLLGIDGVDEEVPYPKINK